MWGLKRAIEDLFDVGPPNCASWDERSTQQQPSFRSHINVELNRDRIDRAFPSHYVPLWF
jgi:hypothetical protein